MYVCVCVCAGGTETKPNMGAYVLKCQHNYNFSACFNSDGLETLQVELYIYTYVYIYRKIYRQRSTAIKFTPLQVACLSLWFCFASVVVIFSCCLSAWPAFVRSTYRLCCLPAPTHIWYVCMYVNFMLLIARNSSPLPFVASLCVALLFITAF